MTFGPINSYSSFLPPEFDLPQDPKLMTELLSIRERDTASIINVKQNGQFETTELLSGQFWFNPLVTQQSRQPRYGYRQVYSFGAIAAGATLTIAHGIVIVAGETLFFTAIRGSCLTAVPDWRPIPYSSATLVTNQIEIRADATNIYIINGSTAPNITSGVVVLEYLKY
jgi:hypothetical protein